ncbi:hypothetical protein [Rhizobium brockwellii]|uniref:hypothetical protein n=1 Tax=Rhizobium brockwellii TaxID=3019932 RepID=UPI000522F8AD|nr:hypothetical protein [Rhizobium brockwellii]KPN22711.1 hypothetical protein KS05_32035 [Rhizobium brockwellii]QJX09968.1 hypothetical protein RLCC275e_33880 [Rhizobium brockwellii]
MLCLFQIPIADLRPFVQTQARLSKPNWLVPEPDVEFLRTFGGLRNRYLGGLTGWVGEGIICRARNAVTFPEGLVDRTFGTDTWRVWGVTKSLFHDDLALAKLEIGYKIKLRRGQTGNVNRIVEQMMTRPTKIPKFGDGSTFALAETGKIVAQKYLSASCAPPYKDNVEKFSKHVIAGRPIVYVEQRSRSASGVPPYCREFQVPVELLDQRKGFRHSDATVRVYYWKFRHKGVDIPVFYTLYSANAAEQARNIRIFLTRMWAEIECLRHTLRALISGAISPDPDSSEADQLQFFMNRTLKRIKRMGVSSAKIAGDELYDLGYAVLEETTKDEIDQLRMALDNIRTRPTLAKALMGMAGKEPPPTTIYNIDNSVNNLYFGDRTVTNKYENKGNGQFNVLNDSAQVGSIIGQDQRVQQANIRHDLIRMTDELSARISDAISSREIEATAVSSNLEAVKKGVEAPQIDHEGVNKALKSIESGVGHVAGIGTKIAAIAALLKNFL